MSATRIKHLVSLSSEQGNPATPWADELKEILGRLVDIAARVLASNDRKLLLNEILTADELAARFKIPVSTIEELARKGKLPGAFRVGKHWRFDIDILRVNLPTDAEDQGS